MKFNKLSLAMVIVVLLSVIPTSAQLPKDKTCSIGKLGKFTTSLDAPLDVGMANVQTFSLDENCNLIIGSVEMVPISELPSSLRSHDVRETDFGSLTGGEGTSSRAARILHADQAVWDPIQILTQVISTVAFTYDGTSVTSYIAGLSTQSHFEPTGCGNGWTPYSPVNKVTKIGPNSSYVTFKQKVSFSYIGVFDCSGTIYDNKLVNKPTVYGNGGARCLFNYPEKYRTWSHLWHWTSACYFQ